MKTLNSAHTCTVCLADVDALNVHRDLGKQSLKWVIKEQHKLKMLWPLEVIQKSAAQCDAAPVSSARCDQMCARLAPVRRGVETLLLEARPRISFGLKVSPLTTSNSDVVRVLKCTCTSLQQGEKFKPLEVSKDKQTFGCVCVPLPVLYISCSPRFIFQVNTQLDFCASVPSLFLDYTFLAHIKSLCAHFACFECQRNWSSTKE